MMRAEWVTLVNASVVSRLPFLMDKSKYARDLATINQHLIWEVSRERQLLREWRRRKSFRWFTKLSFHVDAVA